MLTEVCQYLRNYFNRREDGTFLPMYSGTFTITNGSIDGLDIGNSQYYRITGSLQNDGVHHIDDYLTPETFTGEVWIMSLPPQVVRLASEIEDWQAKYGLDALSPYQSESFGGYSYSKGSSASGGSVTWETQFEDRLNIWRKI